MTGVSLRKGELIRRVGDPPRNAMSGEALREFVEVEELYCSNRDTIAQHLGIAPTEHRWAKVERLAQQQTRDQVGDSVWLPFRSEQDRIAKSQRPDAKQPAGDVVRSTRARRSARRARAANPSSRDWFPQA